MKGQIEKIAFYINCFFVYCFIGWIYEVISMFYWGWGFVNRGFLHGPYLPIYGFGVLFFIVTLHKLAARKIRIGKVCITPIIIFLIMFVLASLIEYTASYLLEVIFHLRLWDYQDYAFNLNGRIALFSSILFGIGGTVALYVVQPLLGKWREKVNDWVTIVLGGCLFITMSVDLIITLQRI